MVPQSMARAQYLRLLWRRVLFSIKFNEYAKNDRIGFADRSDSSDPINSNDHI